MNRAVPVSLADIVWTRSGQAPGHVRSPATIHEDVKAPSKSRHKPRRCARARNCRTDTPWLFGTTPCRSSPGPIYLHLTAHTTPAPIAYVDRSHRQIAIRFGADELSCATTHLPNQSLRWRFDALTLSQVHGSPLYPTLYRAGTRAH